MGFLGGAFPGGFGNWFIGVRYIKRSITKLAAKQVQFGDIAMRLKTSLALLLMIGAHVSTCPTAAPAEDACASFRWDVGKERTLFAGSAISVAAGKDIKSAPRVVADRLYELRLEPQDQVAFSIAPGKKRPVEGAYAGLAALKISAPGTYRVSVNIPFWIDVVSNGTLLAAKDFQGQQGCDAPHKIVEFEFTAVQDFVLQLSGATNSSVRMTVTKAPAHSAAP